MKQRALIIGAGVIGCLSALALARRGWQVTLAERGHLGDEASWAGGGILFPLLPWQYGEAVNRLAFAGAARHPALCAELRDATGIDPEYDVSGMRAYADYGGAVALDWCRRHGLAFEESEDSLWLPAVAQVRNPRLLKALRAHLGQLGVIIVEGAEMQPLAQDGGRLAHWQDAAGRDYAADVYVVTAGAWSRGVLGHHALALAHRPMRGQMLLYRLAPQALGHIVYHEDFYLIPRRDGHVLAGSTVEDAGFDKTTTAAAADALAHKAAQFLPALAGAPILRHWSGLRPGSPDNIPVIDRHPAFDNLYLNSGHFRYGVTMGPAAAELLAGRIEGRPPADPALRYPYPA